MKLSKLFPDLTIAEDIEISGIKTNSREVKPGDLFLCTKGLNADRHDYLPDAVKNGAVAAVVSREVEALVPLIYVEDTNAIALDLYETFYDHPEQELQLIGLTGTDGKTSTATLVQHLLGEENCGYIGTNGASCKDFQAEDVHNTTPDMMHLLKYFRSFRDHGCRYAAMEASSEAFYHHRLDSLRFAAAAYSNLTSEHLNTHKTLENYIACKQQLFLQNDGPSVLNHDDAHYEEFRSVAKNVATYGRAKDNDLQIVSYELYADHTDVVFRYEGKDHAFRSPLLGAFNVENLAEAFLLCLKLGKTMEELIAKLPGVHISGRMEVIDEGQDFAVIVDYAHTPNGVTRFMDFVKSLPHHHILSVSGQAGERDASKRRFVGEAIARNSDHVYFTAEDPRHEDVRQIIAMMCENIPDLSNYETVTDRGEAIDKAIREAQKDDIVVILGKGAESGNIVGDVEVPLCDTEAARDSLKKRLGKE
ncbi:MAG: UDP-N-acetylmuramoyl-L-alanyl-D-glutamate--2,6-diaminopimelate ligase [Erysipelotrichaceae bacterium]|nr:UDP-N-acetylmuramoyl-L-alanyl-D-glutamate--2,6-diaminopimelate ligase [Erysipelotrichaceae bacterium]